MTNHKKGNKHDVAREIAKIKAYQDPRVLKAKSQVATEKSANLVVHNLGIVWVFPKDITPKQSLAICQQIAEKFEMPIAKLNQHFMKFEIRSDGLLISTKNDGSEAYSIVELPH